MNKGNQFSPCLWYYRCILLYIMATYLLVCFKYCLITWQTPPFFLLNLVHIMWSTSKYCCHIFLHSKLNCIFSVASLSTFEDALWAPVLPQPATAQLMLAGIFPSFLGSPMAFTYLFSVAFFCSCKREQSSTGKHSSYNLFHFLLHFLFQNSVLPSVA